MGTVTSCIMKVTAILVCLALVASQVSAQTARPAYATEEESQGLLQVVYSWFRDTFERSPKENARNLYDTGVGLMEQGHSKIQDALSSYEIDVSDLNVPTFDEVNRDFQTKLDQAKATIQEAFATIRQTFEDVIDIIPSEEQVPEPSVEPVEESQGFLSWFI